MRATFTLLAVVFQFLVLVYMAGNREYILNFGELVYLRTAPIEPTGLFSGVTLCVSTLSFLVWIDRWANSRLLLLRRAKKFTLC